jgi:hypothetical protein
MLLAAGIVHLLIAPQHMAHAPAHGLFLGFAGLMQIGWAFEFRSSPTRAMFRAGMALSGGMILLWCLTLAAGAPFVRTPDPLDWSAVSSKLAEAVGMAALAGMAWRGDFGGDGPPESRRRTLAGGLAAALIACLIAYGLGRAAEPLLPGLAEAPGWGPGHVHASPGGPVNAVLKNGMLISGAWVRPPGAPGGSGAAYFSITNFTGQDDTLLEVTADIAERAQLIQTASAAGPVSQITLIDSLPVPTGGPLTLAPGGVEALLVGVNVDLAPGQRVALRLRFERAGVVEAQAEVVANPTPDLTPGPSPRPR